MIPWEAVFLVFASCALAASASTPSQTPFRIAIIGGGVGGTATANYIARLAAQDGVFAGPVHVSLFEKTDRLCGRLRGFPYHGRWFEAGATIFHKSNRYVMEMVQKHNLKQIHPKERTGLAPSGIWNGEDFSIALSESSFVSMVKLFWRYGISPILKSRWVATEARLLWETIYDLQDTTKTRGASASSSSATPAAAGARTPPSSFPAVFFSSVSRMLETLKLENYVAQDFKSYLRAQGFADLFIDELAAAATRVNYGQNPADINALAGLITLIAMDGQVFTIDQGNEQLCQLFASDAAELASDSRRFRFRVVKNTAATHIRFVAQHSKGGYLLQTESVRVERDEGEQEAKQGEEQMGGNSEATKPARTLTIESVEADIRRELLHKDGAKGETNEEALGDLLFDAVIVAAPADFGALSDQEKRLFSTEQDVPAPPASASASASASSSVRIPFLYPGAAEQPPQRPQRPRFEYQTVHTTFVVGRLRPAYFASAAAAAAAAAGVSSIPVKTIMTTANPAIPFNLVSLNAELSAAVPAQVLRAQVRAGRERERRRRQRRRQQAQQGQQLAAGADASQAAAEEEASPDAAVEADAEEQDVLEVEDTPEVNIYRFFSPQPLSTELLDQLFGPNPAPAPAPTGAAGAARTDGEWRRRSYRVVYHVHWHAYPRLPPRSEPSASASASSPSASSSSSSPSPSPSPSASASSSSAFPPMLPFGPRHRVLHLNAFESAFSCVEGELVAAKNAAMWTLQHAISGKHIRVPAAGHDEDAAAAAVSDDLAAAKREQLRKSEGTAPDAAATDRKDEL